MKTLLLLLFLSCSLKAADTQIAWDASPTEGVTNYQFYAHTNVLTATNLQSAVLKKGVGTNLTVRLEGATGPWWFAVTAQKEGLESEPSSILEVIFVPPVKAEAPLNMRFASLSGGPWFYQYLTKYFRMRW
jgi:hypothetical protein